jgi:GntR family transcriptional regulator of arabinose operon
VKALIAEAPKYLMLAQWAKEQIMESHLKFGDKFYSEGELSHKFEISRPTVRQAMSVLENEGYLERRQGSGTFIVYNGAFPKRTFLTKTKNVGVISTYLDAYIFPKIIKNIGWVLSENDYTMQFSLTHNQVENESRALKMMMDNHVDGMIVEPTKSGLPNPNRKLYDDIRDMGIPLIFFNAYYPGMNFPYVSLNDKAAGHMATQYLIGEGHKKIAGLFQADDRQGHLRYQGYMSALSEAGLEAQSANVMWFTTEDIPHFKEDFERVRRYIGDCSAVGLLST